MDRTTLAPATKIAATVGATSTLIVDSEDLRGFLVLSNASGSVDVYLAFGQAAVLSTGILLKAGTTLKLFDAAGCYSGPIYGISASSAVVTGQSFTTNL